jgi:hypothetical protein
MRSDNEKRLSDHDRSLAEQVYNDLLHTLGAACGVQALDVRADDQFDSKRMTEIVAPAKTRDKRLRGCVAWVEEPGFSDERGGVWPTIVAVYSDE